MKQKISLIFAFLLINLSLQGCAKNQNSDDLSTTPPTVADINTTNYENMIQEQAAREEAIEASHPHIGGRR